MDRELSIIDGIVSNLAGIQSFHEFEYENLMGLVRLLKQFQTSTKQADELKESSDIFEKETTKEIKELEEKMLQVGQKVEQIKIDIRTRLESKQKLMHLFESLKSIDSLDSSTPNTPTATATKKVVTPTIKAESSVELDSLPIMEIREELDDDGEIVKSELKPYQSPEIQLKELLEQKSKSIPQKKETVTKKIEKVDKDEEENIVVKSSFQFLNKKKTSPSDIPSQKEKIESTPVSVNKTTPVVKDNKDDKNFRPFVIREEIDEDGNTIKSTMSRIPQMNPTDEDDEKITDLNGTEEVNDDQLNELFEDMGFQIPPVEEVKVEEGSSSQLVDEPVQPDIDPKKYNIDTQELYTLELLADEMNQEEVDEGSVENFDKDEELVIDDIDDYEWPVINGDGDYDSEDESEEDEDVDAEDVQKKTLSNMFGTQGQSLFAQQIMNLRKQKSSGVDDIIVENVGDIVDKDSDFKVIEEITEEAEIIEIEKNSATTKKKSVSFNNTVDIKKVPDIWDDIRQSNIENELTNMHTDKPASASQSLFKRNMKSKNDTGTKPVANDEQVEKYAISDVKERQIVDTKSKSLPHHDVFKTFDNDSLRRQMDNNLASAVETQNLTKLSGRKPASRFKLARAAEQGKKFQETHVPAEMRNELQSIVNDMEKQAFKLAEEAKKEASEKDVSKKEFKKNLKSLMPPTKNVISKKSDKSVTIETPKDINPLPVNPTSLNDEDYEIIRNEVNENLFDDDDEMIENEFVSTQTIIEPEIRGDAAPQNVTEKEADNDSTYFPKYEEKTVGNGETAVVGPSLDYKTLGDDLDTMAKAYVLGLYDDDMATEGEVIEELTDFESHNKIVEEIEESRLHDRVGEINQRFEDPNGKIEEILEDDDPMVVSDVVENNMADILEANAIPDEQLDIELSDETLTTQVTLDYTKMRSNMMHKYNGGFKETDKEKEFVRPEGSERVSRFKMARLGNF